jgi:transposase
MQVKTILNPCHKFKSFGYDQVRFVVEQGERFIEVTVVPRRNSQAICSCCGERAPLYDRLEGRRFEFIPLWGYRVFLRYVMRRVQCAPCGVKVEQVPWASGQRELTDTSALSGALGEEIVLEGRGDQFPHELGASLPSR